MHNREHNVIYFRIPLTSLRTMQKRRFRCPDDQKKQVSFFGVPIHNLIFNMHNYIEYEREYLAFLYCTNFVLQVKRQKSYSLLNKHLSKILRCL